MKWKVPYIDFGRQYKKQETLHLSNFKRIMLSGDFVLRDQVLTFEKNVSKILGVKYVISVNSCTDAILLSLGSLGIKKARGNFCCSHLCGYFICNSTCWLKTDNGRYI